MGKDLSKKLLITSVKTQPDKTRDNQALVSEP